MFGVSILVGLHATLVERTTEYPRNGRSRRSAAPFPRSAIAACRGCGGHQRAARSYRGAGPARLDVDDTFAEEQRRCQIPKSPPRPRSRPAVVPAVTWRL